MLANQLWEQILVKYEKLTSNSAPGIQDPQASSIVTRAQWHYIFTRVFPLFNNKREGLEETEVRMQGLGNLVENTTVSTFSAGNLPNGVIATLPLDFMYSMLEYCTIDQLDCTTGLPANDVDVYVLSHDEYIRSKINPYRKPYYDGHIGLIWRLTYGRDITGYNSQTINSIAGYNYITGQTGKQHQLVTDGTFNITDYNLVYLRLPKDIVVTYYGGGNQQNCELDEGPQQAIIEIAVDMLKEALTQPNQQIITPMQQVE